MSAQAHPAAPSTHFGVGRRPPKPTLLIIVFGLLLVVVGVTAVAQAVLVSVHVSTASVNATLGSDAATVRTFVNSLVSPEDLAGDSTADRIATVQASLALIVERGEILRFEIRDPEGVVRLSSEPLAVGARASPSNAFALALGGTVDAVIVSGSDSGAVSPAIPGDDLLREYFPLVGTDGSVHGVAAIWRDASPILAAIDQVRGDVVLVVLSAAAVVALLLFLTFRAAQRRITRQTEQLLDSTRLDALTALTNHGTLVGELALAIDWARTDGSPIIVALIDIDNFKLVNDTYGHDAGDTALLQVARNLRDLLSDRVLMGRYGPDEFLVVAGGGDIVGIEPAIETLRRRLVDQSLAIDAVERLPISISAGIATYPETATSVTGLLSMVAIAVAEAKASGGDATRIAGQIPEVTEETRSFDVFHGLVLAIDTKDRYTKRHSEDVARYGVFLAHQIGLDAEFIDGLTTAGLLHDVGKIGIPDAILRKPARLTDEEYAIVKQHVALGDSIVRNIGNVEFVRAGIRHHHERWDGRGYLHALAGEDIPLVARILAVGDAFSAMTTTRPYRKALSVDEALRRLGDAAGTQLDERLVAAFIRGIETVPNAPIPGADPGRGPLWVPRAHVA
ncbi:MAG: diguanylate cyclase [Chloroflexota bacterium]